MHKINVFFVSQTNEVNLTTSTPVMGHELVGGSYGLSFHQRWLVSLGRDGQLLLRLTETPVSHNTRQLSELVGKFDPSPT